MAKLYLLKLKESLSNISHALLVSLLMFIALALLLFTSLDDNSEIYLFPRLLSIAMVVLTLLLWFTNDKKSEVNINKKALFPGLIIAIVYILCVEYIGFYLSSFLAYIAVLLVYKDKNKQQDSWRDVLFKLTITALFIASLYLLFTVMLNVRMSMGWFF